MNVYTLTVVISLCALIFFTRSFPFLFTSKLAGNVKMQVLGKRLAAYIMMLLVVYQVNPVSFQSPPYGAPAWMSLLVVITVHVLLHKPLLSMVLGMMSFVFLKQFLG